MKDKRIIKLRSIHNLRDLGGLKNKEGKTIKRFLLLRSAALNKVSIKDVNYLKEKYNLKSIVDLRNDQEKEEKPNINIEDLNYYHLPILNKAKLGITREEKHNIKEFAKSFPDMKQMYKDLVTDEECKANFAKALRQIINNRDGAILWHCSVGKDRCGMISAFLLYLLDVDEKIILNDYLLSNIDVGKTARKYYFLVLLVSKDKKTAELIRDLFVADASYFYAAINEIKEHYVSVKDYIYNELKITKEEANSFKEYVLYE